MFDDCVIMAGGSGTRLWPASCAAFPKQFLPIGANKKGSFLFASVKRALAIIKKTGRVIVIAGKPNIPNVAADCAKLSASEKKRLVIIGEPQAKNTAPAIACALVYSLFEGKNRNMLVLTSDHIIEPLETFKANAALAASCIAQKKLAVFGISPTRPETGYGYIEAGKPLPCGAYPVISFREKPDQQTAKKFAASKKFFWNSGMFAFDASFMTGEYLRHAADVIHPFETLKKPPQDLYTVNQGLSILNDWPGLANAYRKTKSISFDYAIAEKCRQTAMVKGDFKWVDIGNWEDYAHLRGNTGSEVYFAGEGSPVSCHVDSDIPVALAGVEDLIVVIRCGKNGAPAAALITKKGQTQKVREVVEQIKKSGKKGLL